MSAALLLLILDLALVAGAGLFLVRVIVRRGRTATNLALALLLLILDLALVAGAGLFLVRVIVRRGRTATNLALALLLIALAATVWYTAIRTPLPLP